MVVRAGARGPADVHKRLCIARKYIGLAIEHETAGRPLSAQHALHQVLPELVTDADGTAEEADRLAMTIRSGGASASGLGLVLMFTGFMAQAVADDRQRRESTRSGSASHLGAMPPTSAHALAYLTLASTVLDVPDPDRGARLLAPWARRMADLQRAAGVGDRLRRMRRPAVLDQMTAVVAPRPSRVVGALVAVTPVGISPCHVPHLVDAADYGDLVAAHLPGTSPLWGRRFTALALARLAGASSWPQAAAVLGMDSDKAARAATRVVQRISDPDSFWKTVRVVAERLQGRGLVDYAARRATLADLCVLPNGALTPVFRPLGMAVTPQRRRHAAAWVWQRLTAGDPLEAPAYTEDWGTTTAESMRAGWWRFHTRLPAPAATALASWLTARTPPSPAQPQKTSPPMTSTV